MASRPFLALVVVSGCVPATHSTDDVCGSAPVAVVDPSNWQLDEARDDPFPDRPEGAVPCPSHAWGLDDGAFGVSTLECDPITVFQPMRVALAPCNVLEVEVVHHSLTAPTPDATATIALAIDDEILWEQTLPLPLGPKFSAISIPIERDIPAGTPIQFHVRNHGANSYRLLKVDRALPTEK